MRIRAAASVLFVLVLGWTSSLAAQTPTALEKIVADWEASFNAGELEKVAALYTADAKRAPPEADLIEGQEAILAGLGMFAEFQVKITAAGGMLGDDFGSTWGSFEIWEGDQMVDKGRWMNVVKRTDAGWKIHRDIWNSSVAPEAEGCM